MEPERYRELLDEVKDDAAKTADNMIKSDAAIREVVKLVTGAISGFDFALSNLRDVVDAKVDEEEDKERRDAKVNAIVSYIAQYVRDVLSEPVAIDDIVIATRIVHEAAEQTSIEAAKRRKEALKQLAEEGIKLPFRCVTDKVGGVKSGKTVLFACEDEKAREEMRARIIRHMYRSSLPLTVFASSTMTDEVPGVKYYPTSWWTGLYSKRPKDRNEVLSVVEAPLLLIEDADKALPSSWVPKQRRNIMKDVRNASKSCGAGVVLLGMKDEDEYRQIEGNKLAVFPASLRKVDGKDVLTVGPDIYGEEDA